MSSLGLVHPGTSSNEDINHLLQKHFKHENKNVVMLSYFMHTQMENYISIQCFISILFSTDFYTE